MRRMRIDSSRFAVHNIEQQISRTMSGGNRNLANAQTHQVRLSGIQVEAGGVGRARRIVAVGAVDI